MASNINSNNIDGTYPIAGQDNDSQGFRTNFTNIKNNLAYAKSEIDDLQAKAVLKGALTGSTLDNNMAGSIFRSAEIKDLRETRIALGTTSGTISLDHAAGHYYTVTTSGSITASFAGLPSSGKLGRIRLEVYVSSTGHTLTLPAAVSKGIKGIAGLNQSTLVLSFLQTGTRIFEFTTEDGGTSIHIADLTRPRDYFYSTQITLQQRTPTSIGQSGDVAGMIAVDANSIYLCYGSYNGSSTIWKNAAATATSATTAGTVTTAAQPNITSVGTLTSLTTSGAITGQSTIKTNSATGGIGYDTGAGGSITQGSGSGKATAVTLNKMSGQITMNNAALNAGAAVTFTLNNTNIAATDVILVNIASGGSTNSYQTGVTAIGTSGGNCNIQLRNITSATNLSEALVLNFAVIKAVAA